MIQLVKENRIAPRGPALAIHALHADVAFSALERIGQFGERIAAQREVRLAARGIGDHVNLLAGGALHMHLAVLHGDLVNFGAAAGIEVAFLERRENRFAGQFLGVHHHPAAEAVGLFVLAVRVVAGDGVYALAVAKEHVPIYVCATGVTQALRTGVEHFNRVKIRQSAYLFRLHARPKGMGDDRECVLRAHLVKQVLHAHLVRIALRAGYLGVVRGIRGEQADHVDALDLFLNRNVALPAGQHQEVFIAELRVSEHDIVIRQREEVIAMGLVVRGLLSGIHRTVGYGGMRMDIAFKPLSLKRKS